MILNQENDSGHGEAQEVGSRRPCGRPTHLNSPVRLTWLVVLTHMAFKDFCF